MDSKPNVNCLTSLCKKKRWGGIPTPQNSVIVFKWREIDIDYLHHLI